MIGERFQDILLWVAPRDPPKPCRDWSSKISTLEAERNVSISTVYDESQTSNDTGSSTQESVPF